MDGLHHCRRRGFLTGDDDWLPDDPREYFGEHHGIYAIGCNNLLCAECGSRVRSAPGRWTPPGLSPEALYAEPDWLRLPEASARQWGNRLYGCRCFTFTANASESLVLDSDAVEIGPSRWCCAGHPPLELPGQLAGIDLGRDPDWDTVVAAHLGVATTPPLHPGLDGHLGFALTRIYLALGDEVERGRLGEAIAARCGRASPAERAGIALFYAQIPTAPGFDAVLASWRSEPSSWDALPSLWGPEPDLRAVLVEAAAFRVGRRRSQGQDDPVALDMIRRAALTRPGLGGKIFCLEHIDPGWAIEHLAPMMALASADGWKAVLLAVPVPSADALVPACRTAICSGLATRAEILSYVESNAHFSRELTSALAAALPSEKDEE
jgi:hypothetical protein